MTSPKHSLDDLKIQRRADAPAQSRGWIIALVFLVLLLGGAAAWWLNRPKTIEVQTVLARQAANGSGDAAVS